RARTGMQDEGPALTPESVQVLSCDAIVALLLRIDHWADDNVRAAMIRMIDSDCLDQIRLSKQRLHMIHLAKSNPSVTQVYDDLVRNLLASRRQIDDLSDTKSSQPDTDRLQRTDADIAQKSDACLRQIAQIA